MKKTLLLATALALSACTTAQLQRAETITTAVCISAPLALSLYKAAVARKDNATVTGLISFLGANCPAVLTALETYQATLPPPAPAPVLPVIGPERG